MDYYSFLILFLVFVQESIDALVKCVTQNLGFSGGKPIASITIYKCLLHWRSFEAERTSVFDRLIQMVGSALEVKGKKLDGNWIINSNCNSLLLTNREILHIFLPMEECRTLIHVKIVRNSWLTSFVMGITKSEV